MLDAVDLADRAQKPGGALTGFEQRLTDVARCLVGKPHLVKFDKPAGGLPVEETRTLGELILRIHGLTSAQTLAIDHDVVMINRICAESLVLNFCRRIAFGPTPEVLADPKVKAACLGVEA